jgi:hypothetical protein
MGTNDDKWMVVWSAFSNSIRLAFVFAWVAFWADIGMELMLASDLPTLYGLMVIVILGVIFPFIFFVEELRQIPVELWGFIGILALLLPVTTIVALHQWHLHQPYTEWSTRDLAHKAIARSRELRQLQKNTMDSIERVVGVNRQYTNAILRERPNDPRTQASVGVTMQYISQQTSKLSDNELQSYRDDYRVDDQLLREAMLAHLPETFPPVQAPIHGRYLTMSVIGRFCSISG